MNKYFKNMALGKLNIELKSLQTVLCCMFHSFIHSIISMRRNYILEPPFPSPSPSQRKMVLRQRM